MTSNYPGIFERVKAIVIDTLFLVFFVFIATNIFSLFESVPDNARIIAFLFIFLLYDPIFTSTIGGTIGHMIIGIRVKRESDEGQNIRLHFALLRYIIKASLGWISLLTVGSSQKRKAIHDFIAGSVVVYETRK